jgi:hypothetical protein
MDPFPSAVRPDECSLGAFPNDEESGMWESDDVLTLVGACYEKPRRTLRMYEPGLHSHHVGLRGLNEGYLR